MMVAIDTDGEIVLQCVNSAQQVFVYKLNCTTEQQILVFEENHRTYIVLVTEVNIVTVKIAVRCKANKEILFLVVDQNENLCTVWYDEKGAIQFKEVTKEEVSWLYNISHYNYNTNKQNIIIAALMSDTSTPLIFYKKIDCLVLKT